MLSRSFKISVSALFYLVTAIFCSPAPDQSASAFICGAEIGGVYLREKLSAASQNANRTLKNGAPVETI